MDLNRGGLGVAWVRNFALARGVGGME